MSWSVQIKNSARKDLRRIDHGDRMRLVTAIDGLAENPYRGSVLKGELTGLRRIRVGSYRIIYELRNAELVVLVVRVAQRGRAYR